MLIAMQRMPVAQVIKQELGRRIGRQWRAGQKLPAVADLARLLGTGQRNTHRALQELVEDGYLVARPGQGTFVKRDFDGAKLRRMLAGQTNSLQQTGFRGRLHGKRISIVTVPITPGTQIGLTVTAARAALEADGASVDLQISEVRLGDHDYSDIEADGILTLAWNLRMSRYKIGPDQVGCFIVNGLSLRVSMSGRYDMIGSDSEQGGFLAGEQMRNLGHKQVVFLGRSSIGESGPFEETSAARLRGFEMGFDAPVNPAHYLFASHYDDHTAAKQLPAYLAMNNRPRAIFAASDDLALGFIIGAAAHGLECGHDYHIIGFDGQPRGQSLLGGSLSTVEVPHAEVGRRAAELLATRLLDTDQPVRRLTLGCSLIVGETAKEERVAL